MIAASIRLLTGRPVHTLFLTLLLTLMGGLLATIPVLARAQIEGALQQSLRHSSVAGRSVVFTGQRISDYDIGRSENPISQAVDPLPHSLFEVRDVAIDGDEIVERSGQVEPIDGSMLDQIRFHLFAFNEQSEHLSLIAGRLPGPTEQITPAGETVLEAVVGPETADFLNLEVGDELAASPEQLRFKIVGFAVPSKPDDDRWLAEEPLRPFTLWRRISFNPDLVEGTAGVILHPRAMATRYPTRISWRLLLELDEIGLAEASSLAQSLSRLTGTFSAEGIRVETELIGLVTRFESAAATAQQGLLLLFLQSILLLAYLLFLIGRSLRRQLDSSFAWLQSRGFSRRQILFHFGFPYGVLSAVGTLLGWFAAGVLLGETSLTSASMWLTLAGGLIGWVAIVAPFLGRSQRPVQSAAWERSAENDRAPSWIFDLGLIILGGLGTWQLRQLDESLGGDHSSLFGDPLLLLSPTFLLIGLALLFRHIAPLSLRLAAWLARLGNQATVPVTLTWLARRSQFAAPLIFIVTMSVGLTIYSAAFLTSLQRRQAEMAFFSSGSELRYQTNRLDKAWIKTFLNENPEIIASAVALRLPAFPESSGQQVEILALSSIAPLTPYPPDFLAEPLRLTDVWATLTPSTAGVVPAVISRLNVLPGVQVGDRIPLRIGQDTVIIEIRAIIESFTTAPPPFILVSLSDIQPVIDRQPADLRLERGYELWLAGGDGINRSLEEKISPPPEWPLIASSKNLYDQVRSQLVSRLMTTGLIWNAVLFATLGAAAFVTLLWLNGQRRENDFAVLFSLGFNSRQISSVLLVEGLTIVILGGAAGLLSGWLLIELTDPLFRAVLTESIGRPVTVPAYFSGRVVLPLFALLLTVFGVTVAGPIFRLNRVDPAQIFRLYVD